MSGKPIRDKGRRTDVVIVGAGFTGLSAARALKEAGVGFLLLEARDRVGGRVESANNGLGERVDTGGQFLCEDMPELMALTRRYGRTLVETHVDGAFVVQPAMSAEDAQRTWAGSMAIRDRMNEIAPDDPAIAGVSVAAWLDLQGDAPEAKAAFRSMIEGLWCQTLASVPLWYLISNDRRVTNTVGELQYSVAETMHALAGDLARDLGDRVVLGAAVQRVEHDGDRVRVIAYGNAPPPGAAPPPLTPPHKREEDFATPRYTKAGDLGQDGGVGLSLPLVGRRQGHGTGDENFMGAAAAFVIEARAVLVAVPPMTAARIAFSPALPDALAHALSVWRSGMVIKVLVRYARAFWRGKGLSGMVMWRDAPGLFACDVGRDDDHAALVVFVGGPLAQAWSGLSDEALRREILARLAAALGPEGADALDFLVRNWIDDRWSGGAYSDLVLDMDATDAEDVLRTGAPPVHFAASELSPSFPGYVEGAIVAGKLAAARIVREVARAR